MDKIKVKVFIEKSEYGYSAYMDDNPLEFGCIGEGKTVEDTVKDFLSVYDGMKISYEQDGHKATPVEFEFCYDTASFLSEYAGVFSLSGLEKLTGVSQAQLGHFLHGRRKPNRKTIEKIQAGVNRFAKELTSIKFA